MKAYHYKPARWVNADNLINVFRSEDLITSRSLAQHFDFTEALIKWAHSRLRNYFMSASVKSKGKSKLGSY